MPSLIALLSPWWVRLNHCRSRDIREGARERPKRTSLKTLHGQSATSSLVTTNFSSPVLCAHRHSNNRSINQPRTKPFEFKKSLHPIGIRKFPETPIRWEELPEAMNKPPRRKLGIGARHINISKKEQERENKRAILGLFGDEVSK